MAETQIVGGSCPRNTVAPPVWGHSEAELQTMPPILHILRPIHSTRLSVKSKCLRGPKSLAKLA